MDNSSGKQINQACRKPKTEEQERLYRGSNNGVGVESSNAKRVNKGPGRPWPIFNIQGSPETTHTHIQCNYCIKK